MAKVPIRKPQARIVTVYSVDDSVKAEIIKNALEEHGIQCEIGGEHQGGFTGALSIDIIVSESDAPLAKQIITDHNLQ